VQGHSVPLMQTVRLTIRAFPANGNDRWALQHLEERSGKHSRLHEA
jgi:hypothetical protein